MLPLFPSRAAQKQNYDLSILQYCGKFRNAYRTGSYLNKSAQVQQSSSIIKMQEYLQQLLNRSSTTSSNEEIQELTSTFSYLEDQQGYITALARISTNDKVELNIRCAAMAQLTNCMRAHWQPNPFQPERFKIFEEDKKFLKDRIIKLNKELCKNPKLARLAKDVIYFMGDDVLPLLPKISEEIKEGNNLKQCLNFILGAVENYERGANQSSDRVNEFLGWTVPSIAKMVDIHQDNLMKTYQMLYGTQNEKGWTQYKKIKLQFEEVLYLCFKYMKKMIKHISRKEEYRKEAFKWATISINILREQDEQMNSLNVERCYRDFRHSTKEFIYFHRKKWAVKYLTNFLEGTLIHKSESHQFDEESNKFYREEWEYFKNTLREIIHRPTTSHIKMLELQLVGNCFEAHPAGMDSEFHFYMFQTLPDLIIFDEEYREMALKRPVQFLLLQDKEPSDSHLMRIYAGQLWISIANHMAGLKRDQVQPYKLCLEFIIEKAQQPKFLYLAVNLFLRLSKEIDRNSQVSVLLAEEMAHVANTFVSSLLSFPEQCLYLNKAIDVFAQYKKVLSSENISAIQELVSAMLSSKEVSEGHEVVRIKSLIVFGDMETDELDQGAIQYFLKLYIEMINAYEIDRLTFSFQSFILKNHKKIRNYVVPIIQIVSQKFYTALNDKDNEQSTKKHHFINKFNTTEGFINIMAILSDIVSKDTPEVKEKIQEEIVKLLDCYFNSGEGVPEQIFEYQSVIFSFFTRYMISLRRLLLAPGGNLAFYLHLMLINLVGLPHITLNQIQKDINIPPAKKNALMNCYNQEKKNIGRKLKLCFTYLPFMPMTERVIRTEQIETNLHNSFFLEKIVYMVSVFYQSCSKEEEVKGKIATTLMLIKLLEEYQEKVLKYLLPHIWMVVSQNSENSKINKYLKIYNVQLVCLLLWTMGLEKIQEYFRGEQEVFYNLIYQIVSKGELNLGGRKMFREESRRMVLGLSEMLRLAAIHQLVGKKSEEIFKYLLKYTPQIFRQFNSNNDELQDYETERGDKNKYLKWENIMINEGMGHFIKKYREQQQLYDLENEINLVITMDGFNINDEKNMSIYNGDSDLEDLMDPERLYRDSIPSGLDSIQEGYHLAKALNFFGAKQPEMYQNLANVYGFLLDPILWQLKSEEYVFQK